MSILPQLKAIVDRVINAVVKCRFGLFNNWNNSRTTVNNYYVISPRPSGPYLGDMKPEDPLKVAMPFDELVRLAVTPPPVKKKAPKKRPKKVRRKNGL